MKLSSGKPLVIAILLLGSCWVQAKSANKSPSRKPANAELRNRILATPDNNKIKPIDEISESEKKRLEESDRIRRINEQRMYNQESQRRYGSQNNNFEQLNDIQSGRTAAENMVNMIKDQEFQRALEKVTPRAKEILQENPELKSPIGVIAGVAGFWMGRTIKVVKSDWFEMKSRVEGRSGTAQFNWNSPLVNGELRYQVSGSTQMSISRSISSLNTSTSLNYDFNARAGRAILHQPISPNFSISIQAGQNGSTSEREGSASLNYQLNF